MIRDQSPTLRLTGGALFAWQIAKSGKKACGRDRITQSGLRIGAQTVGLGSGQPGDKAQGFTGVVTPHLRPGYQQSVLIGCRRTGSQHLGQPA